MRRLVVRHPRHAGAHHIAIGHDHLKPAQVARVQAIGRIADAVVERISEHRAPAITRNRHPQGRLFTGQMLIKIKETDARLNHTIAKLWINLENLIHATEIEHNRARHAGSSLPIAQVFTAADRPKRRLKLVGEPHDGLHLFSGPRRDGSGSWPQGLRAGRIDVRIGIAVFI